MSQDINTHYDADHNTQTHEDDWENEDTEKYGEALDRLPDAVINGAFLCSNFETLTQGYFAWDAIPALQIYEVACSLSHIKGYVRWLHDAMLSKDELLSGIEIYKTIKSRAASWAYSLAQKFEAAKDNFTATSDSTFDIDIDCFISDIAQQDDGLEHIRETDPVLFGEICHETNRLVNARQQA